MEESSPRRFYDQLAGDYHLIYPDWDASMARQAQALDTLVRSHLGPGHRAVLDCSCGIGTQAIGLAALGYRVTGADLSPVAVTRARHEAAVRHVDLQTVAADMRALPFQARSFDVVICADNALPHLLTSGDVDAALRNMRRVLNDGGLLLVSTRSYDGIRTSHPLSASPQVARTADGRVITFQLWHWHTDGEHYDIEHFQLLPEGESWIIRVRRTNYWALAQQEITEFVAGAGFANVLWHSPGDTGFFQPVLTAQAAGADR